MRGKHHVCVGRQEVKAVGRDRMLLAESISTEASTCASVVKDGYVHGHLVAVEIGVERGANQRVDARSLALPQAQVQRWIAEAM